MLNPADETVLGTVPTATIGHLGDAIAAAERGFKVWRRTCPAKRTQIILKAASLIRERVNDMATAPRRSSFKNVYSVVDGFEGDLATEGPKTGQRVVNGWKNGGSPWTLNEMYKLDN